MVRILVYPVATNDSLTLALDLTSLLDKKGRKANLYVRMVMLSPDEELVSDT